MKHFKKNQGILLCLFILAFIFSYGSINSLAASSPKLKESKKTLYVGYETYQISCTNLTKDTKITYQSDNKSIATVSNKGMVTPVSAGNVNITVTVKQGGKNYPLKLKVTVKNPYIIITNKIAEIEAGTLITFEVKAVGLKDTDIVWYGSNRWAGDVNPYTGEFYPAYPGGITITAKDKKSGRTSVCHMRIERGDVAFDIINKIEEHWSDVSYRFKTEGAEQVRWSVSDTGMASIDQNGLFNAKKAGTITVTAEDIQNGNISSFVLKIKEIEESPAEIFNLIFNESYDTYSIQGIKDKTYI